MNRTGQVSTADVRKSKQLGGAQDDEAETNMRTLATGLMVGVVVLILSLLGCASFGADASAPAQDAGIDVLVSAATPQVRVTAALAGAIVAGDAATIPITVERLGGFVGPVLVSLRDPLDGLAAASLTLPSTASTGSLLLTSSAATKQGMTTLRIVAEDNSGLLSSETTASVLVRGKPGTADLTFANSGLSSTLPFAANDGVLQKDGKLVVAGSLLDSANASNFAVGRFAADGTPDPTFGASGATTVDLNVVDTATSVALTADGKVLVAGYTGAAVSGSRAVVMRFTSTGGLDPAFGSQGKVILPTDGTSIARMFVQPDGRILAAGSRYELATAKSYAMLARFTSDGRADATFGNGGIVEANGGGIDVWAAMLLNGDQVVVAGDSTISINRDAIVASYQADGSSSSAFGASGRLSLSLDRSVRWNDFGNDLAWTPDHKKIVVLGTHSVLGDSSQHSMLQIARIYPTGVLDSTFAIAGTSKVDPDPSSDLFGQRLAVQSDGRLLITAGTRARSIFLARRLEDGAADTSFGAAGVVSTHALGDSSFPVGPIVQKDGRILLVYDVALSGPTQGTRIARFWN